MSRRRGLVAAIAAVTVGVAVGGCGGATEVACPDGTGERDRVVVANNTEGVVGGVEVGVANVVSLADDGGARATLFVDGGDGQPVRDGDEVDVAGRPWLVDVRTDDDIGVALLDCS